MKYSCLFFLLLLSLAVSSPLSSSCVSAFSAEWNQCSMLSSEPNTELAQLNGFNVFTPSPRELCETQAVLNYNSCTEK